MATTLTYTKTGSKASENIKLSADIFNIKTINEDLLHQAYDAYLANGRINLAKTKTRGQVSGGGKKPWRQKGTGRARVGSSRTPIWRGGGIIFGPTGLENYTKKINIKAKRNAIRQALSSINQAGGIKIMEDINIKTPKTQELVKLLNKLDCQGYTLVVTDHITNELSLASRNLVNVKVIQANYLNVARILDADTLVITKPALEIINNWLTPTIAKKTRDAK